MARGNREESVQIAISNYMKLQYTNVIFTAESSGLRVPTGVAKKMKAQRSKHALPDMWILEPRSYYHGLIIELKKSREGLYLKDDMTLKGDKHIQEQLSTLNILTIKGYKAIFCCGFDEAKYEIDKYMKL